MIAANLGALCGGLAFGALSDRIGRPLAMGLAVALALPALPLWATAGTPAALGLTAALLLFFVQGAWGIVPVYLNELSPPAVRATFPGFAYQAGNFLAAANANIQLWAAGRLGGDYGLAMSLTVAVMAAAIMALLAWGPGRKRPIPPGEAAAPSGPQPFVTQSGANAT